MITKKPIVAAQAATEPLPWPFGPQVAGYKIKDHTHTRCEADAAMLDSKACICCVSRESISSLANGGGMHEERAAIITREKGLRVRPESRSLRVLRVAGRGHSGGGQRSVWNCGVWSGGAWSSSV